MILIIMNISLRPTRAVAVVAALALLGSLASGCGNERAAADNRPQIVVSLPPLAALVRDVVGDTADVRVLIPNGVDPHDFQPSAKDAEAIADADLLVVNGLGMEEGLQGAIDEARADGVATFVATDHVEVSTVAEQRDAHGHEGEPAPREDAHGDEGDDHAHDGKDPHIWLDPGRMATVVTVLRPALATATGNTSNARADQVVRELRDLDRDLARQAAAIPAARRVLITGHDSMGYFAGRYGFEVVGAIIPSLSSQAEASAKQVSHVVEVVREHAAPAIFTEIGTPGAVAKAIGDESGAKVVEISTHTLPPDGRYTTMMRDLMSTIATALT